ncbi:hypothetical protein DDZ15_14280 [Rhodohalobacter mucosus]|uniref:Uncharacterized protein n=1 Tax=Rhodohalobacter mucosus TaxID=2079485 RepID=A0A316TZ33_9BACT|nr:hypothetical protein DDZ15_14280 [Rhodohalobacter mucosus]
MGAPSYPGFHPGLLIFNASGVGIRLQYSDLSSLEGGGTIPETSKTLIAHLTSILFPPADHPVISRSQSEALRRKSYR